MEEIKYYAHYERYYFDINSLPNDKGEVFNYRVSLRQRMRVDDAHANPPVVVKLDGGPSPFVISLQDDNDPLMPIRTSGALISFVDDINLAELLPNDPLEWKVVLTRLNDSVEVFTGYLTAEVYTQPAVAGPNIITVNAASPMVPTCATTMPLQGIGMLTIGHLLSMAMRVTDDIRTVYIPAMFSLKDSADAADYVDILNWQFPGSPYARDVNTLAPVEDKYSPYSEPLAAICTLFGWSMVDVGDGALYFTSPGYTGEYLSIPVTSLEGGDYTLVTPAVEDIAQLVPIDNNDTVEIQQGYQSATLNVSAKSQEIALPSLEGSVVEQKFSRETVGAYTYTGGFQSFTAECAGIRAVIRDSRISMPKYYLVLDSAGIPEWRIIATEEEALMREGSVGAYYRKIDWANPDTLKPDAEQPKRGWKFEEVLMMVDAASYTSSVDDKVYNVRLPDNYHIFRAYIEGAFIPRGAVVIDFSMMASPFDGFYMVEDNVYEGGNIESSAADLSEYGTIQQIDSSFWGTEKKLRFSLKIADLYYNGSAWVKDFSTFEIPVNVKKSIWHPVDSNKTVDDLYDGDSGYYIPTPEPMAGNIEMCIYPSFYPFSGVSPYAGTKIRSFLKDLSLSFAEPIEQRIENESDKVFFRVFREAYTARIEKTLALHTKVNVAEQATVLYDGDGKMVDTVYSTSGAVAQKLEEHLLDEYERLYARPMRRWRRGAWLRDLIPITVFSGDDASMTVTGYTADVEENIVSVFLSDCELGKIERYVE